MLNPHPPPHTCDGEMIRRNGAEWFEECMRSPFLTATTLPLP